MHDDEHSPLVSRPPVFRYEFALVVNFYSHSREGLRWHGKNHESHKEMFESPGANKSILATIRELVKYLMELYLHSRQWVAGLNMEGSWANNGRSTIENRGNENVAKRLCGIKIWMLLQTKRMPGAAFVTALALEKLDFCVVDFHSDLLAN